MPKSATIPAARQDGRPQYYDIALPDRVQCYHCLLRGNMTQYGRFEAMICDPANSPADDGKVYSICVNDLPDNAVIHDPYTNVTRDKSGQNTWTEADSTEGIAAPKIEVPQYMKPTEH